MAASGKSRANENRRIRQDALREQLSNKGLLQQVIETSEKLADLAISLEPNDVSRLKAANDARLAVVKKYLPDLKQSDISISGPDGDPINVDFVVEFIVPKDSSTS